MIKTISDNDSVNYVPFYLSKVFWKESTSHSSIIHTISLKGEEWVR